MRTIVWANANALKTSIRIVTSKKIKKKIMRIQAEKFKCATNFNWIIAVRFINARAPLTISLSLLSKFKLMPSRLCQRI